MQTLLQVNSSLFSQAGQSTQLANRFVARWREANAGARVIVRDLAVDPVPHLDARTFAAFTTPADKRTAEQSAGVALSDALVAELKDADVLVFALPFYNLGAPSTFKAWLDHVARAGQTFRYTEKGPVGLLAAPKAYVFAARGGRYQGTPRDSQVPYMREVLGLLGVGEIEFVFAEGLAISPQAREQSLVQAAEQVDRLVQARRAA